MKKTIIIVLAVFFAIGIVFSPAPSNAADVKLGVTMMGDWYKPGYMGLVNESEGKLFGSNTKQNLDGSFMMGPNLWAGFGNGWSLNFQMLFGLNKNTFEYSTFAADIVIPNPPFLRTYLDIGDVELWKMDADVGVAKELHKYVSLLIGVRFSYDDGEADSFRLGLPGFDFKKEEFSNWSLGPSLGVGLHFELYKNLVLGFGTSFIVQFGAFETEKKFLDAFWFFLPYNYEVGHFDLGLDSYLKLSYYIEAAHLEVFVGGRYIFLGKIVAGDDGSVLDLSYKEGWITGKMDHFGGITFGAAYKF
ncbi:MAG TPA: hypothetical protein PK307_00125 [Spirochaetota bacterium]|nr:hypothetical protein [Spirochaetota bacterium]HOD15756.1 hypothetical protein [Spirochaetota bacterium]HPG51607.1 hypothetical protein [Spirochaetota bacterium]HPN12692.1 hypothetical protein [Spirochaetota bacterium]HQL80575.1 hypothetical protein [Spirochaetota bacterium]